jgi:hypothetical protein
MNPFMVLCKVVGTVLHESVTDPWHRSQIAVDNTGRVTVNKALPAQRHARIPRAPSLSHAPTGYAKA